MVAVDNYRWAINQHFLHFKGGLYKVTKITRSSEDPEKLSIVYEPVDGRLADWDGIPWDRPAEEFFKPERRSSTGARFTHVSARDIVTCSGCPFWAYTNTIGPAYCIACLPKENKP